MILKTLDTAPPDFYRFTHPETGYESKAIDPYTWMDDIIAHRKANNLPPITFEAAQEQLCETLPPGWCQHPKSEQKAHRYVNTRLKWSDIVAGIKPYIGFMLGGTASQAEADRRARICSSCYLRVQPQGCGACVKIARLITGNVAGKKTAHDHHLVNRACGVCACPVASLVWFPMPTLEKPEVDSPEKQQLYPPFCWRKRDGENYQP